MLSCKEYATIISITQFLQLWHISKGSFLKQAANFKSTLFLSRQFGHFGEGERVVRVCVCGGAGGGGGCMEKPDWRSFCNFRKK